MDDECEGEDQPELNVQGVPLCVRSGDARSRLVSTREVSLDADSVGRQLDMVWVANTAR